MEAKPHNYKRGDRVEIRGVDVQGRLIAHEWTPGEVLQADMHAITIKVEGLGFPRTILPGEAGQIRPAEECEVLDVPDTAAERKRLSGRQVAKLLTEEMEEDGSD